MLEILKTLTPADYTNLNIGDEVWMKGKVSSIIRDSNGTKVFVYISRHGEESFDIDDLYKEEFSNNAR